MKFRRRRGNWSEQKQSSPKTDQQLLAHNALKLAAYLERAQIGEYIQLLNNPWRLLWLNFIGGTARGVGVGFGLTVVLYLLVVLLQQLVSLPVIGEYMGEIARIVKAHLETPTIP